MENTSRICFFYVLYGDKTWVLDQSERAQGPIYTEKLHKEQCCAIFK